MTALQLNQKLILPYVQNKYGDHDLQRFGVWERPGYSDASPNSYWVIFLHGGAWRDPRNTFKDFIPAVEFLHSSSDPNLAFVRGFISIDHRLSPHPEFPQDPETTPARSFRAAKHAKHLHDVYSGLSMAQKLYSFGNNYIFIGHSSGATIGYQLLMGGSLTPSNELPQIIHLPAAVVAIYGIYNLVGLNARYDGQYSSFLTGAFGPDQDVWKQVSPSRFKGDLTAAFHGAASSHNSFYTILADSADDKLLDSAEVETMRVKLVNDAEILPPQISIPLLEVSSHLSLPPVLTAAAANLWHYSSSTPSLLSSVEPLISFTRTTTESWFLAVGVVVESHGGAVTRNIFSAMKAESAGNFDGIVDCLEQLVNQLDDISSILARLPEKCDPSIFYHDVRPFYAGTKNMADAGLPRGVFFDMADGRGEWRQLRGGSNGQSSLFPLIDAFLGIRHGSASSGKKPGQVAEDNYHAEILNYMPREHRELLQDFTRLWDLEEIMRAVPDKATVQDLRTAHMAATTALARFRSKHIQIVSRYIILPSRKSAPETGAREARNLATMYRGKPRAAQIGTSGTDLIPFLKQARQQTLLASTKHSQN
ncbi:hypothetical protein NLG97_g6246 [Lecanicillium saksenae]|uniref:Uncharacterized protein n=1 Tax=Lecanicillium saksenae TaxID=468837 RepID=A0ACC1QSJ6_9HYPO|nr:hypothetical protein NLG97_g6246 [Lecanicillium saksenae]